MLCCSSHRATFIVVFLSRHHFAYSPPALIYYGVIGSGQRGAVGMSPIRNSTAAGRQQERPPSGHQDPAATLAAA